MTAALDDLIPISALTHHLDRFRCVPFSVDMQAAACLANQDSVTSPNATPDLKLRRGKCLNCADGKRVRLRLAEALLPKPAPKEPHEGPPRAKRKRTVRSQDDEQDGRKASVFFPTDMAEEIDRESVRLDRTTTWLTRRAWMIAKDRIRQIQPEQEPEDDSPRVVEPQPAQPLPTAQKIKPVEAEAAPEMPRCAIDGCAEPSAATRPADHVPPDLAALCVHHRKIEKNRRWRADQRKRLALAPPASAAPSAPIASSMTPATLAELHEVCVGAGRQDLAITIGTALAAAVRKGASL